LRTSVFGLFRLYDGEKIALLCAQFGISPKTGYKLYERYRRGWVDRSQLATYRHASLLPIAVENATVRLLKVA
jgi:putative transposase